MGIKYNPLIFSGLDLSGRGTSTWESPVAGEASLPASGSAGEARIVLDTDHIYVWDTTTSQWIDTGIVAAAFGATPNSNGYSINLNDKGNNVTEQQLVIQPANVTNPGAVSIIAQTFKGNKTFADNVTVSGDLTITGDTYAQDQLHVSDHNITVNVGGTDITSEGAGLTIERVGTNGSFIYQDSLTSKFKIGALASESEVVTVGHVQTISANKTMSGTLNMSALTASQPLKLDASKNLITALIVNADIDNAAAINAIKIANGTVTNTEFQFINSITSNVQDQLDGKQPLDSTLTSLAAFNSNGILVQTAADTFVSRTLSAGSTKVSLSNPDGVAGNPTIDVDEANIDHDSLSGYVANEHIDWTTDQGATNIDDANVPHTSLTDNPHSVTKTQVGLSNVPNVDATARANHTGTQLLSTISDSGSLAAKNTVATADIDNNAVDNTKLSDMPTLTIKGNDTGGTTSPQDLTAVEVRTLLNVEDGATADQTDAEIKIAYENNADTNAFTDTEQTKLGFITVTQAINLDNLDLGSVGDVGETEVALAESQIGTTLFTINPLSRSVSIVVSSFIDATVNVASLHKIEAIYDGVSWTAAVMKNGSGDIEIDVDAAGNVIYDSTTYAGFVGASSKFKYRVTSTTI